MGVALIVAISLGASDAWAPPAPPLTYLQVRAAWSQKSPWWERFSDNQFSSTRDHGGTRMEIRTVEIGYSRPHSRYAEMNGRRLRLIKSVPIFLDWDRIVDGWERYWDASGLQSGVFRYRATSINAPWNTMSDAIYIR